MSASKHPATPHAQAAQAMRESFEALPLPVVDLDSSGAILNANSAALRMLRVNPELLSEHSIWDFMVSDQVKSSRESFFLSLHQAGALEPIRRTLCDLDGGLHTCDICRSRLLDERGEPHGLRYYVLDVTGAFDEREDCRRTLASVEGMLDSLPEAVVACDPLGFIAYVNPAAERVIGWKAKELEGKLLEKALPLVDPDTGDQAILAIEGALNENACAETCLFDSDGRHVHVVICSAPWLDKSTGSTAGVVSMIRQVGSR